MTKYLNYHRDYTEFIQKDRDCLQTGHQLYVAPGRTESTRPQHDRAVPDRVPGRWLWRAVLPDGKASGTVRGDLNGNGLHPERPDSNTPVWNEKCIEKRGDGECLLKCVQNPGNFLESEESPDFLTIMSEGAAQSSNFDDFATPPWESCQMLILLPLWFSLATGIFISLISSCYICSIARLYI